MNKLENVEGMHPSQLTKHYFPEYPLKVRKDMEKQIPFATIEQFNDALFLVLENINKEKEEKMPLLLNSIALNSLGFEVNERLAKTCYMDYHNKAISKHGRQFVEGQYKIFRNDNEKLLLMDPENLNFVVEKLESAISLMIELGVNGIIDFEEHLRAIKKDPKSIQGIVNKVLKNNN